MSTTPVIFNSMGEVLYNWPFISIDACPIVNFPLNLGDKNYSPKFKYGYGLKYKYLNE